MFVVQQIDFIAICGVFSQVNQNFKVATNSNNFLFLPEAIVSKMCVTREVILLTVNLLYSVVKVFWHQPETVLENESQGCLILTFDCYCQPPHCSGDNGL